MYYSLYSSLAYNVICIFTHLTVVPIYGGAETLPPLLCFHLNGSFKKYKYSRLIKSDKHLSLKRSVLCALPLPLSLSGVK